MKPLAISTAIILTTLAVVAILLTNPEVVVLFLLSLAIAAATRPMVETLTSRGLVRGLAVVLTYLVIVGTLIVLLSAILGPLFSELKQVSDGFLVTYDRIWSRWPQGTQLQQTIVRQLPPPDEFLSAITGEQGSALAQTLFGITSSSFGTISKIFATLVLSIYWTIDRIHFERLWLSLLPVEIRARWRNIGRDIENDLGAYIRSELVQSVLAGLLIGLGFYLVGLPYPTLAGIYVALVWLIPWLGAVLALLPAVIIGLSISLPTALVALVWILLVLALLELLVEPRLWRRRQYSPWLTVIFIMALADAFGLAGVIIASPLAAMLQTAGRRVAQETTPVFNSSPELEAARRIAELDDEIGTVRAMISQMDEKPAPQTISMLERLDKLIQKANEIISE